MTTKTVKLHVDNSCIMDSIEKANLKVTSPSGKTVSIYKTKLSQMTEEQREVFWKFCPDMMTRFQGTMDATVDEMQVLLDISKI